ncbi:hypothetical protein HNQ07_000385 [Deinococcus metalli]|uniref:Uncharacterized protein n=1 Tax=Deinococcus metalli TaxID=1141878 RepID=A0A7W8KDB3_9DEIO|nr:hypothetical protein [Deinococcus metalli]MBB5374941.1 hypothetical protein [Deinococcus metalli]GHF32571.1 hypothetical protein GCM10017781_06580 [Deinococcus metalli]
MTRRHLTLALLLCGTAQAQTWTIKDGTLTLVGCHGAQDGIYCDFRYVLTGKQVSTVFWNNDFVKVYGPGGTSQPADKVAFADNVFGLWSSKLDVVANTPLNVQAYFNLPSSTTVIKALEIAGKRLESVPVRALGTAAAPASAAPSAAPFTGFAVTLSNCVPQGPAYVCTATLTPSK